MAKTSRDQSEPKRVAGYLRVSTLDQADSGLGLKAQEEQIRAFATVCGFQVAGMFCDAGESGTVAPKDRMGLSEALAQVRSGRLAGIVVAKLDRLSRSCRDVAELVLDSEAHGWDLLSVSEKLDTSTPSGKLQVRILASFAEFERDMISARTKDGLLQVAKQGRIRTSKAPFGWKAVIESDGVRLLVAEPARGTKAHLERDPQEQKILRRMLKLRKAGCGARKIANALNAKPTTHNPRTGNPWHFSNISQVLRSYDHREAQGLN